MYMNVHKTGFLAVFHISVMIFKLVHLIHLDLDHQNVFRQFHILFYQNHINSTIRLSGARLSGIRLSGIRLSGIRLSGIRLSGIRLSGIRYPSIRHPSIRYPVSGTHLFYHALVNCQTVNLNPRAYSKVERGKRPWYRLLTSAISLVYNLTQLIYLKPYNCICAWRKNYA